jgi:hypothetical protein
MKKTLLLAAALACSGAVAQEKEVWACQMEESTMLRWEDNGWKNYAVKPFNILLTLNADNTGSIDPSDDNEFSIECSEEYLGRISCLDGPKWSHFLFSPVTGKLGVSRLLGATVDGREYRDSVSAEVYNCTKF